MYISGHYISCYNILAKFLSAIQMQTLKEPWVADLCTGAS